MSGQRYDLLVIGSGPAGQKAAIAAAKLRKRVAIVDRRRMIGGVCIHTGTIPSKTLREAILYLSGYRQRTFYGRDYTVKDRITVRDLAFRVDAVVRREIEVVRSQLRRNGVEVICGDARFVDPHRVVIESKAETVEVVADHFVVACGTRPAHSPGIPLDGRRIVDSDQLLRVPEMHKNVIVLGAGVIGLEYASMLSALGVDVTIVDGRPRLLDFVDEEMIDTLCYHMRKSDATFRLGEKVASVAVDGEERVVAKLESGKRILSEALLYTAGRKTNSDLLDLAAAGLSMDERGRIAVDEHFRTGVPHIYAAGDVIGFPCLASSSMEQGRLAACHMFGAPCNSAPHLYPYGIYTIPEISMVGKTEQQLTAEKIPYEVGTARFEELAKGQMIGDEAGRLKLLFCPDTRRLLGVHAIGEGVTELIHIGQAVMSFGGTIDYLRDTVFNYPTLAEAYKVAALDGLNKL